MRAGWVESAAVADQPGRIGKLGQIGHDRLR
jgi:hypothetical protein